MYFEMPNDITIEILQHKVTLYSLNIISFLIAMQSIHFLNLYSRQRLNI